MGKRPKWGSHFDLLSWTPKGGSLHILLEALSCERFMIHISRRYIGNQFMLIIRIPRTSSTIDHACLMAIKETLRDTNNACSSSVWVSWILSAHFTFSDGRNQPGWPFNYIFRMTLSGIWLILLKNQLCISPLLAMPCCCMKRCFCPLRKGLRKVGDCSCTNLLSLRDSTSLCFCRFVYLLQDCSPFEKPGRSFYYFWWIVLTEIYRNMKTS